jgi:hypothetical protein
VALAGTFNLDTLLHGSVEAPQATVAVGGLCYSLLALARLLPGERLLPLAWLAAEDAPHFAPVLASTGCAVEGLCAVAGRGNHITLDCRRPDKPEVAELRLPPLAGEQLEGGLACPRFLLNCCSGRDVALETWRSFREEWRRRHPGGWLQLDWHSLSLDWREGRPRRLRQVPRAFDWVQDLDLLQMTLFEAGSLTGRPPRRLEDAADLVLRLRKAGCRRIVVTAGAAGLLFADGSGLRRQAAWPPSQVRDTTGCGDVLGAALLATLGRGWPVEDALPLAARMAGLACAGVGLAKLDALSPVDDHRPATKGKREGAS